MTKFYVQQYTGFQYEDLPEGEFETEEQALAAIDELVSVCGFEGLRVDERSE